MTLDPATFVPASDFADKGGWLVDQMSFGQVGASYLLAHGMGRPVEDAATTVTLPAAGAYQVHVYTYNWMARWGSSDTPGRFQVSLNDQHLPVTFGTTGDDWGWISGGEAQLEKDVTINLKDQTGFAGRCAGILLVPADAPQSPQPSFQDCIDAYAPPAEKHTFDLVVVGGGMAGMAAAIGSARLGMQVALVHDRPVLGGNYSSEVVVSSNGGLCADPYPAIGTVVKELTARPHDDQLLFDMVAREPNLTCFLNHCLSSATCENNTITTVTAHHICSLQPVELTAPFFVDCTGDGTLGFLSGADWRTGREAQSELDESLAPPKADQQVMGATVPWNAHETDAPQPFPSLSWALPFTEENCRESTKGGWNWEGGFFNDHASQSEMIRDGLLRAIYGNWSILKNHPKFSEKYANHRLEHIGYVLGKRESRRLVGDILLREQDILHDRHYHDACVMSTWGIDIHYPKPEYAEAFPDFPFFANAQWDNPKKQPYLIPYRCLYSRNITNLWMAGRNISVSHVALGQVRVQNTTGMMGEVVAMAAYLAKKHGTTPSGVYQDHLKAFQTMWKEGLPAGSS